MADENSSSADSTKSWRGQSLSQSESEQGYGWQNEEREGALFHIRRTNIKRLLQLWALGSLIVGIVGLFLLELLFTSPRTPMLVISPSDYEFPFRPLSWAQEDLDAFLELDRETLDVRAITSGWKTKDQGLRQLDSQLSEIMRRSSQPKSLILYLRMHAAVDGAGVACLVPPGASPFNSDSWLPLKDVFERLRAPSIPPELFKVVIIDCHDVLTDWKQGIVFNTFASRIQEAVSSSGVRNLGVISAASPYEVSKMSAELKHGVFGHFLRRGLEGIADTVAESGNGDGQISAKELHRYLLKNVNDWSLKNRNCPQRPQLLLTDQKDFDFATSLNSRTRKRIHPGTHTGSNSPVAIASADITSLWEKIESCQSLDPLRFDPCAWTSLEQKLRWVEIAAESGAAYNRSAQRHLQDLRNQLYPSDLPGKSSDRQKLARWAQFSGKSLLNSSIAELPTTPLSEFFGVSGETSNDVLDSVLSQFKASPSAMTLQELVRMLSTNAQFSRLELTCILELWQKYNVVKLWPDQKTLPSVIEIHQLSDSASTASDERVHDWIRSSIETADNDRRKIDDQIFAGGEISKTDMEEARQHYEQAIRIANDVSHAYALRDELDHVLPYLAQWLCRPPLDGRVSPVSIVEAKPLLIDLMRNLRLIENTLRQPSAEAAQVSFQLQLKNLDAMRNQLVGLFAQEYERLLESEGVMTADWNDINALISIPILPPYNDRLALAPSQQRSLLREKQLQIERKLADKYNAAPKTVAPKNHPKPPAVKLDESSLASADSESGMIAQYLEELLVNVPDNLGLIIVQRDQNDADVDDSANKSQVPVLKHNVDTLADSQGRYFRMAIKSVAEVAQLDTESQLVSNAASTFENSLGERLVRATASVAPFRLDDDPIELRRGSDLQGLLLWNARRVLEDFWNSSAPGKKPYFETATRHLVALATTLGKTTARTQNEVTSIGSKLKSYQSAALNGLTTLSDRLLLVDDSMSAKIAVYQDSSGNSAFPPGSGAVYIRDSKGDGFGVINPLAIPWVASSNRTATEFDVTLSGSEYRNRSVNLQAVTFYRGHEFTGDLAINSIEGILVQYAPHVFQESQITVRGTKTRKLSVVFVLDCSNSMGEDLPLAADRINGSRLQIAKVALESMLEKLAEEENHRVGVVCFGHRIGWDLKQAGQLLRQTAYTAPIPDQVRPYDDVETVLPLGRFNASFAGAVMDRLESIRPWGESPLYLALIQALKMFEIEDDNSDKCIVVITDGVNYQFNPPVASRKTIGDVFSAWREHPVPIHVVGLGITADQAAVAQREFGEIAGKTNGTYVPVQESRMLAEQLASLQKISEFHVRSRSTRADQGSELGRTVTVETPPNVPNVFDVSLEPARETLALEGGESIDLISSRDGRQLDVVPYEIGRPQIVPLVQQDAQTAASDLAAGIHRPLRRGRNVTFEFSIRNTRRRFVARPASVWIEVSPTMGGQRPPAQTYVFYDANFLPNTSVPVLRWAINDWPEEAVQARVRVAIQPTETFPTLRIPLAEAISPARNPDMPLDGLPGLSARIRVVGTNPTQISVLERHSTDSAGVGTIKVHLKSSVVPTRVQHRFDAANRVVSHSFEFNNIEAAALENCEIEFTTREAALAGTWRTVDPVVVDVTESGDVHN